MTPDVGHDLGLGGRVTPAVPVAPQHPGRGGPCRARGAAGSGVVAGAARIGKAVEAGLAAGATRSGMAPGAVSVRAAGAAASGMAAYAGTAVEAGTARMAADSGQVSGTAYVRAGVAGASGMLVASVAVGPSVGGGGFEGGREADVGGRWGLVLVEVKFVHVGRAARSQQSPHAHGPNLTRRPGPATAFPAYRLPRPAVGTRARAVVTAALPRTLCPRR